MTAHAQMVGPVLAESAGALPEELASWLDNSPEGVIVVSMVRAPLASSSTAAALLRLLTHLV